MPPLEDVSHPISLDSKYADMSPLACNAFQGSFSGVVWPTAATRRLAPARVAKAE